jgi:hypothetical protein
MCIERRRTSYSCFLKLAELGIEGTGVGLKVYAFRADLTSRQQELVIAVF